MVQRPATCVRAKDGVVKHLTLGWRLVTGLFYSCVIGLVSGYLMINEEYMRAFDEWRK